MNSREGQVVIDVTVSFKVEKGGAGVATVEGVKDAIDGDRTEQFKNFAGQENFDLTKQEQIEAAAEKFAKDFASVLP